MAIGALTVRSSGKRSVSVTFTSAATTDALTMASIAALLSSTANSEIKALLSATYASSNAMLTAFANAGVVVSLIGPATGDEAIAGAGEFTGFVAGGGALHMLRIAMSSTVSA